MREGKREPKYPMATVAFYGPDNKTASKVVVGIIANADAEPEPMRKWVSGEVDVRDNKQIQSEIKAFLKEHRAQQIITIDRIIGCPHEEGSDYPVGAKCPFCPFWRNRNRFTHENEEN
jgi:hypothetical protein